MKKKIYALLVLLMAVMVLPVNAKSLDAFQAGENVKLQKDIDSTTFVAGQKVDVKSTIKGMIFAAGQKLNVAGANDYAFVAGQDIEVKGMETRDAFIAGQNITIEESSIRDLYVAGEDIEIDSNISRNVFVAGGKVTISGKINGDVYSATERIVLEEGAEITGTLTYDKETKVEEKGAKNGKNASYESTNVEVDKETVIVSIIMEKVTACLAMIILACVALFIAKPFFQKLEEEEKSLEKSLVNVGYGVGVLFATPVLAIIATIISAIALMIPFPVVVLGLIAYGVAIYLSAIPTAYYLGNWFLKDKINNKYAYTALALVIIYLVRIIPIIGGFVTFLVVSFGTGVYFKSLLPEKKSK